MLVVQIHTLASTDAFIVFDLEGAPGAGIVRSAPKILVDGATTLARTLTYRFATFERRIGGASAGINAKPDVRPAAVAAFAAEANELVGAGRLLVEAGRGVSPDDLAAVTAVDPRPEAYWTRHDELTALGVAVAAETALGDLAGCSVAIEGFDATGPLLAAELVARGAKVTAVATSEGTAAAATGLDVPALALAWAAHGPACVRELRVGDRRAGGGVRGPGRRARRRLEARGRRRRGGRAGWRCGRWCPADRSRSRPRRWPCCAGPTRWSCRTS